MFFVLSLVYLMYPLVYTSSEPINYYHLPGMHQKTYQQLGDINIGALVITDSGSAQTCQQQTKLSPIVLEQTEAIAFAVDLVNRSPDILPNVTLGFVIRGTCDDLGPAIASSMLFMPRTQLVRTNNDTVCSPQPSKWLNHDVIGVLSMGWSSIALPISSLYATASLPMIGATETSDAFSDKKSHPYFFRISPPQMYQIEAILKFITRNGWSYVSVLYSSCSLTSVIEHIENSGICIATKHKLSTSTNYDDVVSDLLQHSRARTVLLFGNILILKELFKTVKRKNVTNHFIWIGSNNLDSYIGIENEESLANDPALGTFYFDTYSTDIPELFNHLRNVNPSVSKNPWLKPVWQYLLKCSFDNETCETDMDILQSKRYRTYKGTSLRVDAILTLAHAAHDLLSDVCPGMQGEEVRACITGELLRQYLKTTSFEGFVSPVKFDENQDIRGRYQIKQLVYDYPTYPYVGNSSATKKRILGRKIGIYDISTETFTFFRNISWDHLKTLGRIVPWSKESSVPMEIPESVCSRPCLFGEYKIEKKVSCCWECRRCRDNERFVIEAARCEACPLFTWPDPDSSLTSCVYIPLSYSTLGDTIPTLLGSIAILAIIITISVSMLYIIYRDERIIKASSRELSVLQLIAIFVGYTTVVLFQITPSHIMCKTIFFLFCMSFALLYCPLLAKAIRIFRIFRGGTKNERPRFISPHSQLLFSSGLIAIQIILCVTTYILYPPGAKRIQPVWTEKLVELSCDFTLQGLSSFLGYNLVLVSLCSVFAFLTRKLPDNFNESKFISMCVSTTLLIWLAFIPTYFTAEKAFVRVFLLSVALLLNHSVALLFLFTPKIYAAVFLSSESGKLSDSRK